MKRLLFLIILLVHAAITLYAQESKSLLEALQAIEQSQSEYTIDILSDGLEELTTTAKTDGLDVVSAVKRLCKGLPVKVKVHGQRIYVQHERKKSVRQLKLKGEVQDIRAHKPLIGAHVELLASDSTILQQTVASHHYIGYGNGTSVEWDASDFSFTVPAMPAKYIFRISYLGHRTAYVDYKLDRIGRREYERALPPFYLTQQSTMLDEVVVIVRVTLQAVSTVAAPMIIRATIAPIIFLINAFMRENKCQLSIINYPLLWSYASPHTFHK